MATNEQATAKADPIPGRLRAIAGQLRATAAHAAAQAHELRAIDYGLEDVSMIDQAEFLESISGQNIDGLNLISVAGDLERLAAALESSKPK